MVTITSSPTRSTAGMDWGGGRAGGGYSFVAFLGRLAVDHALIPFEAEHRSYSYSYQ